MIKLIIKQVPFYISSFTALFLALANTGPESGGSWLDRLIPIVDDAEMALISEEFQSVLPMTSGPLDFVEEQGTLELWVVLAVFLSGGLLLGYLFSRLWKRLV